MAKHDKPKQPQPPTTPTTTAAPAQEPALTTQAIAAAIPLPAPAPDEAEMTAMQQNAEAVGQPNAEQAMEQMLSETLRELEQVKAERDALQWQLQPAHDTFGPNANARGVLLSHVRQGKDDKKTYDVGGRYRVCTVSVEDGRVTIRALADIVGGEVSEALPWGLARSHIEKAVEDFITPKAHRS